MVSPGSALPLGCEGKGSDWVAVIRGATAKAACWASARGAGAGALGLPALEAPATRGVRSEAVIASERKVPRRDFRGKASLNAFDFMDFSYRGWWLGVPSQTRAWRREVGTTWIQ